jgi:hypothetical protein
VSSTYAELHELVDRLTPEQADAVHAVVRHLVVIVYQHPTPSSRGTAERPEDGGGRADEDGTVRRLSFAGTLRSGKGDLAARSEDIIRAELGDVA